jgi:hypothetical protein
MTFSYLSTLMYFLDAIHLKTDHESHEFRY